MKRGLIAWLNLAFIALNVNAQVQIVTDTIVPVGNEVPQGYVTLRIYVSSNHPEDAVNAVVGSIEYPLTIKVYGGNVWNHNLFGASHSGQINCNLGEIDSSLRFDSYVTIGDSCANAGNSINVLEDPGTSGWLNPFFQPIDSSSGEISINSAVGGGWFVTGVNASNTMGADLKVMIAQITTNGTICGKFNVQVADSSGENTLYTGLALGPDACSGVCDFISVWSVQQPLCALDSGALEAIPSGGYPPYLFSLNNVQQNTLMAENLSPDIYTASVEDAFGCVFQDTLEIQAPNPIVIEGLLPLDISESPGGNSSYVVSGGVPPYQIFWNGPDGFNSSDENLPPLTSENQAGEYTLTITDHNGCISSQSIIVTSSEELSGLGLKMYPNPSSGIVILEGRWSPSIRIIDLSGRDVPFVTEVKGADKSEITVLANSGVYVLTDSILGVRELLVLE